jgi:mRNA interferase RelE/StbE
MRYHIELSRRATRDLEDLPVETARRIVEKIERLQDGLTGDVKRLSNFVPAYRLRVGDY